jgi:sulfate/thiosulfate transport system ATP-binding protein
MSIDIREVRKSFGSFTALDGVSLRVESGGLVALLGPSGSGKTTLLRVIAGLEAPERGAILFDGQEKTRESVRERRVGFVFQHYALFRHMNVFENVAFGLRVRPRRQRLRENDLRKRVLDLLALVQIEGLAGRYPSQLSGGQRQRVALARALAVEPRVLLLDEPFGALDAKVRKELRRWLRRLHDELHVTSVLVTHDQEEAMEVADHVVILNEGRIEQVGTPEEVYSRPASPFVLSFLGDVNLFRCRIEKGAVHLSGVVLEVEGVDPEANGPGTVYIRPHVMEIEKQPGPPGSFPARVLHVNPAGPVVKVDLSTFSGEPVRVDVVRERYDARALTRGASVYLRPAANSVFVVPGSRRSQPPGSVEDPVGALLADERLVVRDDKIATEQKSVDPLAG